MPLKIGAAYIRVSTEDQTEYSPDSQLQLIRDFAKRVDYIIPPEFIYQDDGISGKTAAKRPAFRSMIAAVKQNPPPFESVFVWKYSRFARNQEEAIVYKNLLKKSGVSVVSISEPSSDNPFSSLIERIIEWMDEYYVVNLADEVRRGMTEKAKRGECMGTAPYGYRAENKTLVPVPEEAKIVQYIYNQFAAGKGCRALAVDMADMGIKTRRGNAPDLRWIKYILENPVYIGKIRWSTDGHANYTRYNERNDENTMIVDGKHPAIISRELWDTVQAQRQHRRKSGYTRGKTEMYMLHGLLKCDACGSKLTYVASDYPAVQCYKYAHGQCKISHNISLNKANGLVIKGLEDALDSKSFVFAPTAAPQTHPETDWDKLVATEQTRLNRAKNALLDGAFTSEEYKALKAEIESKIETLRQRQQEELEQRQNQREPEQYREKVANVLEIIKNPAVDETAKNKALHSIIDYIEYKKPQNEIAIFFY